MSSPMKFIALHGMNHRMQYKDIIEMFYLQEIRTIAEGLKVDLVLIQGEELKKSGFGGEALPLVDETFL